MLDAARSFDELRNVRDLAIAAEAYAKAHKLGRAAQAYAVEIALLAMRRMAEQDPAQRGGRGKRAADAAGLEHQRRSENRDLLAVTEKELREIVRGLRDPSRSRGHRIARDRRAKQGKPPRAAADPTTDLRHGDFREVLADIEPGSVDLILTDPPYPKEFLPLWADLGAFAARALKPEGLLAAMSGHTWLPTIYWLLGSHLTYRWTIAYLMGGQANVVHARRVSTQWKPVLVYGSTARRFHDVVKSETPDKLHHEWGQSESGMLALLRLLADPGAVVCDPFAGGSTTALVAREHGCRFIGAEIDEAVYREAVHGHGRMVPLA
jgi:16S rRNA G966 N2-methylase RsmD